MAVTIVSGTTNASRASVASEVGSYTGVRYATALLGSGHTLIVGGKSIDGAGVVTTNNLLTTFGITAQAPQTDGSIRYSYEFHRNTTVLTNGNAHIEDCQAVALIDAAHLGKVLVTGGHTATASTQAVTSLVMHRLAPEVFAVTNLGVLAAARGMHRMTVLADGRVLATGGFTTWSTPLATCERWTPSTEAWTAAASMATARMDHAQVRLADGRVLVVGGLVGATSYTSTCELYDPAGNTWTTTGRTAVARAGHALVLLPSGQVLVLGGTNADGAVAAAELWDPSDGRWRPAGNTLPRARCSAVYVPALTAAVVVGGDTQVVELWDAATNRFRPSLAQLARVRREAQAVLLPEGVVLVPGGTETVSAVITTTEKSHVIAPGAELVSGGGLDGYQTIATVPSPTQVTYASGVRAPTTITSGDSGGGAGRVLVGWAWVQGSNGAVLNGANVIPVRNSAGLYTLTLASGTYLTAQVSNFNQVSGIPMIPRGISTSSTVCDIDMRNRVGNNVDADFLALLWSTTGTPLPLSEVGWAQIQGSTGTIIASSGNIGTARLATGSYTITLTGGATLLVGRVVHSGGGSLVHTQTTRNSSTQVTVTTHDSAGNAADIDLVARMFA